MESSVTQPVKTPLISVIMPVYNVRQYLIRATESVFAQTYPHLELILVDDGSTDGSGELCDEIATQHPKSKIQVIHQTNQGLSAARNAGIAASEGKYLTFVDSDDEIIPTLVSNLYHVLKECPAKMSICSFAEVWPNGKRRNFTSRSGIQTYSTADCLAAMLQEQGFTLMACGKLYARELFDSVAYPVGKLYEDVGTTYKLVMQCAKIPISYEAGYLYYQNSTSIIHQKFTQQNLDLITLTDQMCDEISTTYPSLDGILKLRRMHARFSILRMLGSNKEFQSTRQTVTRYLVAHRDDVLKNPNSTRRDRLAMRALMIGPWFFDLAWRIYGVLR